MLPSHRSTAFRRSDWIVALLIAIGTLLVFWPARSGTWINFDDLDYVPDNPHVTTGLSVANTMWAFSPRTFAYWHPLTWISLQADVSIWGMTPGSIHLQSILWHAIGAAGFFLLWVTLTGRRWSSAIIGILFAIHPTRVESVAWISERKDVLAGALMVLTMLVYCTFTRSTGRAAKAWYAGALGCYAMALMAKPMVVTVPFLMFLLDWWPLSRLSVVAKKLAPVETNRNPKRRPTVDKTSVTAMPVDSPIRSITLQRAALEKCPFAALAAVAAVLTLLSTGQANATATLQSLGIRDRFATAVVGCVRYLGKLVLPTNLSIFYPYRFDQPVTIVIAAAIFLAAISWLTWRDRVRRPYLLFGWGWFVVSLLPVIGIVQSGQQAIADRFIYTAAIGPFVAIVWLIADGVDALTRRGARWARPIAAVLAAAVIAVFVLLTTQYLPAWKDSVSIWTWAARSVGDPSDVIETHLGDAYVAAGHPELSIDHYAAAVDAAPNDPEALSNYAGVLMRYDPATAVDLLSCAVSLRPGDAKLRFNLGLALRTANRPGDAAVQFRQALQLQPDFALARMALQKSERSLK